MPPKKTMEQLVKDAEEICRIQTLMYEERMARVALETLSSSVPALKRVPSTSKIPPESISQYKRWAAMKIDFPEAQPPKSKKDTVSSSEQSSSDGGH
ncbi:uncharacterized protein CELE_H25K10.2 [Caenorhabditis elegans]|uniref:Uncharacterized protein n=1 Tax=Caenorhabditis elegans TaxID=6239 RepID=Q9XU19_CAEEL|nr:Uncharacterized protein CELE_H25K10.2 [Caenorhabditis elegans]CAB07230.2 Uncharacterized protein CELE_H25K10.2 [Caenorhabditis elegans]|eukprot:NP_502921.2 Uncharacterized protein CELE_H25K10.2 [Caenorhabditis elegans]